MLKNGFQELQKLTGCKIQVHTGRLIVKILLNVKMNFEDIKETGELPKRLTTKYGDSYSVLERLSNKKFGMGRLIFRASNHPLEEIYTENSTSIRTSVEPTSRGLIFRVWTPKFLKAFGLTYEEINQIKVIKEPDYVNPFYHSPMWFALKAGVPVRFARYLAQLHEYKCGVIRIRIQTLYNFVEYEINGFLLRRVVNFFNIDTLRDKSVIEIKK